MDRPEASRPLLRQYLDQTSELGLSLLLVLPLLLLYDLGLLFASPEVFNGADLFSAAGG